MKSRKQYNEWSRQQRKDKKLEKASRTNTLDVDLQDVKDEHEKSGALFSEIVNAAEYYGIFEDLFDHVRKTQFQTIIVFAISHFYFLQAYFNPIVNLTIEYDFTEELVTPVFRGNVIKPKEATTVPHVYFKSDSDSLWTLVMTNPDGHFTEDGAEYLHWMVGNIKGNDLSSGEVITPYMQPFPPAGTGFHRLVFLLFKQVHTYTSHICIHISFLINVTFPGWYN